MTIDPTVLDLLEDVRSGLTPEEACADRPDLLEEVRARLVRLERVCCDLDWLFPAAGEPRNLASLWSSSAPEIPGHLIESVVGRGGMGVVYKARHLRLNRAVAVKMTLAGAYAGPPESARFLREAEALAALAHPNIVRIFEIGDVEGRAYFTMEYVEGGNLAQRLASEPQPALQAAALVATLADAVRAAHEGGIVHRDLKPSNVLLTADGVPKITDFGLASRFEADSTLTQTGDRIGTPSYMAPEQADHRIGPVGPGTDIFALGAILYEMLTGRPPFRAETAAETVRRLLAEEPAAPSRLNTRVPRDLETICLKCLTRDPAGRYPSAESLGEDLRRLLNGEAIEAKPEGPAARLWRRVRRNPGLYASLGCAVLLAVALLGVGLWLAADSAERRRRLAAETAANARAAGVDLRDMTRAMGRRAWAEASLALDRAKGRLGEQGEARLLEAIGRGRRDLDMIDRLEKIRMESVRVYGGELDVQRTSDDFGRAFRDFALGGPDEPPAAVASRIAASHARSAIVDALDIWPAATGSDLKAWTIRVARLAAGEESGWVADARDPDIRSSRTGLERLIAWAPVEEQPVTLLLAIADDFQAVGGDSIPFRTRLQQAWPGDFWANYALGDALGEVERQAEAIRYLQAALAIRPDGVICYQELGYCLATIGRTADAIGCNRAALRIDPGAAVASFNLAVDLRVDGRVHEAVEVMRSALRQNPSNAICHLGLADSLSADSMNAEAMAEYRRAAAIDPALGRIQERLRPILMRLGRTTEVMAAWRSAIEAAPGDFDAADGFAEFSLFLGDTDAYRDARRDLLKRSPDLVDPRAAERTGRACLLLPGNPEETARAAALIDRALSDSQSPAPAWAKPYFLVANGLAEYRLGRFQSAVEILRGEAANVLGPCPLLITAMAQERLGLAKEARESLEAAVRSHQWNESNVESREHWIYHILRREAEATVRPRESARDGSRAQSSFSGRIGRSRTRMPVA